MTGALGASLLGNLLIGKVVKQSNISGRRIIPVCESRIRPVEGTINQARIFNAPLFFI